MITLLFSVHSIVAKSDILSRKQTYKIVSQFHWKYIGPIIKLHCQGSSRQNKAFVGKSTGGNPG